MKPFLITIDTEGDNLWGRGAGAPSTRNAEFIPRFQDLCDEFDFKPTYLTNWEMAKAQPFVSMARAAIADGRAEVGSHIHAWDSPPHVAVTDDDHRYHPYLIEYPDHVLLEKVRIHTALLEDTFGRKMVSHRAGRWAMDERYARALVAQGYTVDCSVTPGVDWSAQPGSPQGKGGTDYRHFPHTPYYVDLDNLARPGDSTLLEVPMTTRASWISRRMPQMYQLPVLRSLAYRLAEPVDWLRLKRGNLIKVLQLIEREAAPAPYLEFMIHSSEFMPGGSPYFPGEDDIEQLFADMRLMFSAIARTHRGMTMGDFAEQWRLNHPAKVTA